MQKTPRKNIFTQEHQLSVPMLAGAILGIILIFKLTGHGPEKPQNLPDDNPSYVFAWALGSLFKLGAGGLVGGILGGITEKIYKHVKSTHHSE